jgi:3'(2'), 5'-bisphosphate nucleotidase
MTERSLPDGLLDLFYSIAIEAGKAAMSHYGSQLKVEYKEDLSPLTLADKLVDGIICNALTQAYSNIPIISEERPLKDFENLVKGQFFLVDPIDGTKEFIQNRDAFTINIALIDEGMPVAGLLYAPALGRLFIADVLSKLCLEHRIPVVFNGQLSKSRAICHELMKQEQLPAIKLLTSQSHPNEKDQEFIELNKIQDDEIMRIGSSLKFALIAAGEAQIYPRFNCTMEWDTAAGQAILTAAGGAVVDFSGQPLRYGNFGLKNGNFIAKSNSQLYSKEYTLP